MVKKIKRTKTVPKKNNNNNNNAAERRYLGQ
jgi:hypothetical protein